MSPALQSHMDALLRAAALRGAFDPKLLLHETLPPEVYADKVLRVRLLSALHEQCTETHGKDGAIWLLRPAPRQRALAEYDVPPESGSESGDDISAALSGSGAFAPDALDALIDGDTAAPESSMAQMIVTLERAGQKAPGHAQIFALRSKLTEQRQAARSDALLGGHFVGRRDEISRIEAWMDAPRTPPPLASLHIQGLPGIGKSFLLERITQLARARHDVILIRLDFDRPSLQVGDGGTVLEEVSRQIGHALPRQAAALRALRLRHSERITRQSGTDTDLVPRELLQAMVEAVLQAGKRLVLVLDTLEVLQAQGATFVSLLLEDLDRLAETAALRVAVISAGRGVVFEEKDKRLGGLIRLETLETAIITAFLAQRAVPEPLWDRIITLSAGNPLRLRLLLSKIEPLETSQAAALLARESEAALDAGYVHRAIASRLPRPLQRIANQGLILTELTADLLVSVVAPALELGAEMADPAQAAQRIEELAQQQWLVQFDGTRLTQAADIRAELLEQVYRQSPRDTAALNRAARDHYATRDPLLSLYHALQLMRNEEATPAIEPALAERMPDRMVAELPLVAQDLLRQSRGQRSAPTKTDGSEGDRRAYSGAGLALPGDAQQAWLVQLDRKSRTGRMRIVEGRGYAAEPDTRAVEDLRITLEQGQRHEATQIIRDGLTGAYDPASDAGLLFLCHQWLTGHWSKAHEMLALLPEGAVLELIGARPQLEGRILAEISAEFEFRKLVDWLGDSAVRAAVLSAQTGAARIGLNGAALDFALLAAGVDFDDRNAVSVLAPHLEKGPVDLAQERLREAVALRSDLGLDAPEADPFGNVENRARHARAIAPTNPYADRVFSLVSEIERAGRGRILTDLARLRDHLTEANALFTPWQSGVDTARSRLGPRALDTLALIRGMGLMADWAEGYALFHALPDLPALARALSRWQQVSAGYWAYDSAPPAGWQSRRVDSVTQERASALRQARDSAKADRMLRFWTDPEAAEPAAGARRLKQRLSAEYAALAPLEGLSERLAHLQPGADPQAFAAPLAVLCDLRVPADAVFRQTGPFPVPSDARPSNFVPDISTRRIFQQEFAMSDPKTATLNRLETMGNAGLLDRARAALDSQPAILQELGLTVDRASELLGTQFNQLESVGGSAFQLEAIVRAIGRPPLVVRGGKVEGAETLGTDFPANVDGLIRAVEPAIASVGRIEFVNHDMAWGGTGWVIDRAADHLLIITNRHVAKIVARRSFLGDGVFMFAPGAARYGARIDFLEEADAAPDPARLFAIEKFTYIAEDAAADIALGRIALPQDGAAFVPEPLTRADTDAEHGETIAVIGYPAKDSLRNDPSQMARYFQDLYDVKRFSPGLLIEDGGLTILRHDATTLGGNSGSPVLSLDSGKAVGLHYAGTFGVGNSAVRISTVNALLDGTVTTVPGFEIASPERRDGSHDATHFNGREGYDPQFLQVAPVPLPAVPDAFGLAAPSDATAERPHELRYQNFGALYSGTLKTPVLVALNIDGAQTRPQKRGNDKWFADLRLPAEIQLGKEDYDHDDIDRGHLIRRAATNWGVDEAQAALSNADSFHYTVAAPQHRAFNRSHAQWLGLENYIMNSVRTHGFRACVFTGPILTGEEPLLKTTGAVVPLKFFKLVTMLAEEDGSDGILRLHATAYVLSQVEAIQQLLSDQGRVEAVGGFAFGEYKTFQVRIADLETMSRLDFGVLRDADPLARRVSETETTQQSPRPLVEVEDYANIVL